ncbi:MAG TPA: Ig-like domain-containing protein, partial [Acidobacteriota bacterium]|nr:Ig-like domain-containing protein [Acidobacteriota bacterium]
MLTKKIEADQTQGLELGLTSGNALIGSESPVGGSHISFPWLKTAFRQTPIITATKTDALQNDVDTDGAADPGDRLRYTVVITNSGGGNATGVNFSDTIGASTTLVAGSVVASPLAINDSYSCIGNVGINVTVGGGVIANDLNPLGIGTLTVSATSTAGLQGTVTVNTDGSFQFTPTAGFEGSTSFTYTLSNGSGLTDTGTVTINVSGMIWFVNNNAGVNGDGRLNTPFNSLANFNSGAADDPGDNIFLYRQVATNYTGGITLLANQKLIGQGATASLAAITGITVPTFSNTLPSTGGTRPTLTHTANNVVVSTGNTIRGVDLQSTGGSALFGTSFNNLNASENTVSATGGTAAINLDQASSTAAINLNFISISANGSTNGIILADTTGSFTVTGDGTNNASGGTIQSTTSNGISLNNVQNISLTSMRIQDITGLSANGIFGTQVNNFAFSNNTIQNVGNLTAGSNAHGIAFDFQNDLMSPTNNNVSGTVSITNSTFTSIVNRGVDLVNHSGSMTSLTISGNSLTGKTGGSAGIMVAVGITGTATAPSITISSNTIVANSGFGSGGIVVGVTTSDTNVSNQTPSATAVIQGNTISACDGNDILATVRSCNGTLNVRIQGNNCAAPVTGVR